MDNNSKNWLAACGILLLTACLLIMIGLLAFYLITNSSMGV